MSRCWMALACACALSLTAAPAFAAEPKPAAKKADATDRILDVLSQPFEHKEGTNLNDIPLIELFHVLSKKYDVNIVIKEEQFQAQDQPNIKEAKPNITATALRGLTVHQFLTMVLGGHHATYLIRNGSIEIVTRGFAAEYTKVPPDEAGVARLLQPLVSANIKEKPLNEAVAKIAEMYDLTVIVSPHAGDGRAARVSARLLNVPADKAIELLALQGDLRVVRRANTFLITNKEQANQLTTEELKQERQKVELGNLRSGVILGPNVPFYSLPMDGGVPLGSFLNPLRSLP